MSVVSVKEINDGRDGGDGFTQEGVSSEITRQFRVITNSAYDGADTVLQSCDNVGVVHPSASWLCVKKRRARADSKSKLIWIATLSYSSIGASPGSSPSISPLASPADVTWQTEYSQENAYKDKDGNAVMNSACDYYEDGVPVDAARWVASITKNVPYVPSWIDAYKDAINSDGFWLDGRSFAAYTAKLSGISIGTWNIQNGVWFRQISMTIKFKNSWRFSILDQGLRREVVRDGEYVMERCINGDGTEVTKPALLNGIGYQLASPTPETAVFNGHNIYPELPFSILPLY